MANNLTLICLYTVHNESKPKPPVISHDMCGENKNSGCFWREG